MEPKVADDLLWGVEAIAKEIGQPVRQVYWRLENGRLPAGKDGQIWVAPHRPLPLRGRRRYRVSLAKTGDALNG